MDLSRNGIGAEGAGYLAAALSVNQVRGPFFMLRSHHTMTFTADSQNTGSFGEQDWPRRCGVPGCCIESEPGERTIVHASQPSPTVAFITGSHNTGSFGEPDHGYWCRASGRCIGSKPRETTILHALQLPHDECGLRH
jgi:hypothetical protein